MEQEKLILAKDTDQRFSDERGKKYLVGKPKAELFRTKEKNATTVKICNFTENCFSLVED